MITRHWISCARFTVEVETDGDKIVRAAPIVRKFLGQPLANLLEWAQSLGEFRHQVLP